MKLTILGATGATGTCLTSQALAAGHEVTAVVRDPARLAGPAHPRLRTVSADVMDPASIAPAIAGADAVIVCADMRRGEDEIRDSDLDWTIFRPPALNGKAATGAYRTAIDRNLPHGFTVSRADLAACMLAMLGDPATVHRHVAIAS